MKKIFATGLFIFFSLFIYAFLHAETVSISGKVTQFSATTGLALNDIVIDVTGTSNMQVRTGRSGNYIITGLQKGGNYTLTVSKPGYTFEPSTKSFRNLVESKVNQNFIAEMATYSISGKVVVGGKPVRGVLITINNRTIKYYTGQDGEYVIDNLEYNGGPYEVSVVSDKHFFKPFRIEYLEKNVVHDFIKDIIISGRITSLGQGVGGIEVDVNGAIYKTDEDGFYKVSPVVANGDYIVKVVEEKYNPSPSSVPIRRITGDKFDINFVLSGQLIGKVTYGGKPFKDVIVKVSDREQEYKTNAQGMFQITDLGLNHYYKVSLSSEGYTFVPKEREIKSLLKESSYQNFKAEIKKYSITVNVNQGQKPLGNVDIIVNNNVHKTDKNGFCVIKNLAYGKKYTVTAKKQGVVFIDSKKVIDKLKEDEKISFETLLSISGKVLNNKKPLKDAIISCGNKKVKTDASGKYILNNLAPLSAYTISVSSKNFAFDINEIEVESLSDNLENINFTVFLELKKKAEEPVKQEAEELLAKKKKEEEEKLARFEVEMAERKAKEEQAKLEAEIKKLELEEKKRAEKEAKEQAAAERKAKLEAAKAEKARIKAEKEELARKAKEEKLKKAKIEAEEKEAKEEQRKLEAERKKLEIEEKKRAEKEAKEQAAAERKAKLEAAKAEKARIKAEKEELARKAKEEKLKAKIEAEELATKKKEEEEKLARFEVEMAERKAKEEQAKLEAEIKKLELEEKKRAEKEAKEQAAAERKAKLEAAKAEKARIKAEKEELARKAKEEKLKAKIEAEELATKKKEEEEKLIRLEKEAAEKKAKEEQAKLEAERKKLELEEKARAEELAKKKEEEERLAKLEKEAAEKKAKEEQAKLEAERKKLELEEKARAEELAKKKEEEERLAKLEKEAAEKKAKEEQAKLEAERKKLELEEKARAEELAKKTKEEQRKLAMDAKKKLEEEKTLKKEDADKNLYIDGRVLKSKNGVKGVQVRLLLEDEEKIFLTDKNGYYKISGLEKGKNYLITVLSGKESFNLSPKSRTYKALSTNMRKQNFYVIENIGSAKNEEDNTKSLADLKKQKYTGNYSRQEDWSSRYGFENKDGLIKKDINW